MPLANARGSEPCASPPKNITHCVAPLPTSRYNFPCLYFLEVKEAASCALVSIWLPPVK